jgi:hypothetical protein
MEFCKYRHVFGKEGEGVHKPRLFGVAAVDLLLTIAAAFLISYMTKYNVIIVLLVLFVTAIAVHRLFCVNTALNIALGLAVDI